jgi:dGTPase
MSQRSDRRHAAEGDDAQRTPFERDRDAILYTSAFRRLAGVTQVVSPGEGQVYHNRLTHWLEVAQIAQRLAQKLRAEQTDLADHFALDPSVVETAALAHDLGHPPFGHIAEKELNKLLSKDQQIIDGYEGNAQSFRIVTKLAVRYESEGLNLTRACLNANLKYPRFQEPKAGTNPPEQSHRKWGAYRSEQDDFRFARGETFSDNAHQCLEAQIMDWADDIAYSIHDTEDFYRAGLIPLGQLSNDNTSQDRFLENVFERWNQEEIPLEYGKEDLIKAFRSVCETMPFDRPYEPSREQRAQLRGFTSEFIGRYVKSTRLRQEPGERGNLLEIDDEPLMQVKMLKELTWQFVIKGPSLIGVQSGQRKVVTSLFDIFADAVLSDDPHGKWAVLSARNRAEMDSMRRKLGPRFLKSRGSAWWQTPLPA